MTPLRLIRLALTRPRSPGTQAAASTMAATFITAVIGFTVALGAGLTLPSAAWAAEEVRAVASFQAVALEGSMTVKVARAENIKVQVFGSERAVGLVETVVEAREGVATLVVRSRRSWFGRESDAVVQVQEIPRTLTGKKMEVPVRKLLLGAAPAKVASPDAMQNPGSLQFFVDYARTIATA